MIALYNSTDGDNWTLNSGWKTPPLHTDGFAMPGTEDTWIGIYCNAGNTTVEVIEFYYNQLTGSIPPELGDLSNLQSLQLGSNQLTGSIPIELMNLINLSYLYICENHIYTNDPDLRNFLTDLAPGWENCQTLPQNIDFDDDGDVDGSDLKLFMDGPGDPNLGVFSDYFGDAGWH